MRIVPEIAKLDLLWLLQPPFTTRLCFAPRVVAGEVFVMGAFAGDVFIAGVSEGEVFLPGAVAGQVSPN